ncbi:MULTISPECIES: sugar phosphate isomerase/epimerase family protein [unclassified Sphingomonas]|uniref:sugar phosphate isomerase/epimerase family protein n=1 Tax=unclassified Sphingomonas TaxID=196159 RepID=UPI0006FB5357|nr:MULTISPECIES: sugar phosphate isomerase/epimerase family protein [unclassified Sphingomonas]KQM66253.1 hydroxypyruvate isomerase [Sphingomonas sp. Leaf16]KQN08709.1 hydroxypyruvate isomerase [Sphingomonas sp. Leaf29]KQN17289.1 hydroxypyruvate isomerase [Sphingomonas sp. Leaf32]
MSAVYQLSSCIEWQFAEAGDLAARLRAARDAGFTLAEFHLWRDKPIAALAEALADTGIRLTSLCVDPRRSIVDPAERDAMVTAVRETIEATVILGKPSLIVASGFRVEGMSEEAHFANAVAALRAAADAAEAAGIQLLLEPLNTRLFATMYLVSTPLGLDLVEAVNSPNLRLLYDVWHSAVMGEDMRAVLADRIHLVGHVQVADMPDRNEPGTGTLDWAEITRTLRALGYAGAIGLEYFPTMPMEQSLAQSRRMLAE